MSAPKTPGLTHFDQRRVEGEMENAVCKLEIALRSFGAEVVRAGVAEWALRYAMRAGLVDEPRVIVRRAGGKRR